MDKLAAALVLREILPASERIRLPREDFAIGKPIPSFAIDLFRKGPKVSFGGKQFADLGQSEQNAIMILVRRFALWVLKRLREYQVRKDKAAGRRNLPVPAKELVLIRDEKVLETWSRWIGPKLQERGYIAECD